MFARIGCLMVLVIGLWANTTMCRGIVVEVNATGDKRGRYIVVQSEYQTPRDGEDALQQWHVRKDAVILLDGVKADFSAFQPGRLVWLCNDAGLFKVFTRSYRFDDGGQAADPATAWWMLHLPAGVKQPVERQSTSELILHLQVLDGQVQQAVALTPGWGPSYGSSAAWHAVDAAQLQVRGGRLSGRCAVTLSDRGAAFADGATTSVCSLTIDLGVDGAGTASRGAQALKTDRIRVLCRAIPTIPDDYHAFLRAPDPADRGNKKPDGRMVKPNNLHVELRRQDGVLSCPSFSYGYGKPGAGAAASAVTMERSGDTIQIEATGPTRGGEIGVTMTGFIIGDRIFGSAQAVYGKARWDTRFSGYLRQADSPSISWTEKQAKKESAALKEVK